jgi:tetratricopeptide (TPR) repeat protein
MIVLWSAALRQVFWQWAHEVDTYCAERGQKYITVRMPQERVWDSTTPSRIEKDLREFRNLRRPNIHLPQVFSLVAKEKQFRGVPSALLQSAIIEAAKGHSDLITFSSENPLGAHPMVTIEEEQVTVTLSGLTSVTYHTKEYSPDLVLTKLPHDILTAVAFVLHRAGHSNIAAQIASEHLDKSTLLEHSEIFGGVLQAIARGQRLTDGLRLADALLQPGRLLLAQALIVPALMSSGRSGTEGEYLRQVMKRIIERFEESGQMRQAATAHYNLGNHLRARRRAHDRAALRQYRLASKQDPTYLQKAYFWREVAGILFGLGRFAFSARAYQKAISLDGGKSCVPLRADALMFAGMYKEAHEVFRHYGPNSSVEEAEWYLKSFALDGIMKLIELESQRRNTKEATRLADVKALEPEAAQVALCQALRQDALCALAWFNLGVTSHALFKPDDAFLAFLLAGLLGRTDPDAWANAVLLSISSPKHQLLVAAIVLTAYRINGQAFLEAVSRLANQQHAKFPADELMDTIWEVVNSVERPAQNFEVRVLGDGASYQSLKLGPGLIPKLTPADTPNQPLTETNNGSQSSEPG